jgi:hypothetical protein
VWRQGLGIDEIAAGVIEDPRAQVELSERTPPRVEGPRGELLGKTAVSGDGTDPHLFESDYYVDRL